MLSLITNRLENYARNWVAWGFFVYLGAFFVLTRHKILAIFLIFVALPVVLLCAISRFKCIQDRYVIFVCTIFLGYFSLSALWGEGSFFEAIRYSFYILCLMLSIAIVSQRFSKDFVIKSIIFLGLLSAVSYIIGIFLSDHSLGVFLRGRFSFYEIGGWGDENPINSCAIMGVSVIAAWYIFPEEKIYNKLILIITIMLCAMIMFITKSRGPIFSAMLTVACFALFRRRKSDFFLLFFFITLAAAIFLLSNNFDKVVINRLEHENYRLHIWREGLNIFSDHWLFGQGYKTSARIMLDEPLSHAHNTLIEILRIGGIVGGALFIYMFGFLVRLSYLHSENRFYLSWLFFGLLCMSTNGRSPLIDPTRIEFPEFWMPFLLFYFLRKLTVSSKPSLPVTHEEAGHH